MSCVAVFGGSIHGAEQLRHVSLRCVPDDGVLGPDSGVKNTTTKVKFLLQKKCMFGEHFKVTGTHSSLGCWDPEAAVPLEWSDGHSWTAELEVPQGEEYEYKFVLKCRNGGIEWQPGPNRVFSTLKKPSSLLISQTWESNESQSEMLCNEVEGDHDQLFSLVGGSVEGDHDSSAVPHVQEASVVLEEQVDKEQEPSAVVDNEEHHNEYEQCSVAEAPEVQILDNVVLEEAAEEVVNGTLDKELFSLVEGDPDSSAVPHVREASVALEEQVDKEQEPSVLDNGEHHNEAAEDFVNGTLDKELFGLVGGSVEGDPDSSAVPHVREASVALEEQVDKEQEPSVLDNGEHRNEHPLEEAAEDAVNGTLDKELFSLVGGSVEGDPDSSAVPHVREASVALEEQDYEQYSLAEAPEVQILDNMALEENVVNGTLDKEDAEDIQKDSTAVVFEEKTVEVVDVEADVQPSGLTLWRKDRAWFMKAITAISSFFKR